MYRYDDFDELDELENLPRVKNMAPSKGDQGKKFNPNHKPKVDPEQIAAGLEAQRDDMHVYPFSYDASRHERLWITASLGAFYEMHWFSDVLRLVRGGKEASVYQCAVSDVSPVKARYLAAKIYRPRMFRNLRKDHLYREGREELDIDGNIIRNHGMQHAMAKRTEYGQQLLHTSWIGYELQALQTLHAAGADVPQPFASGDNAILMTYLGGDESAAPTLNTVELTSSEARPLFQRLLHNVEIMLAHGLVHGDLSAYNVLYWEGEVTLIDFPQVISPRLNSNAYRIFERDLTRLCEYFKRQGVRSDPHRLASRLWSTNHYRRGPEVDLRLLDAEDERDRKYWERQKRE
jgi:RIO kinase 1